MDCEYTHEEMDVEEQIMIMIDGLDEPEGDPDLLDLLGSEPQIAKKGSLNYDYQPSPISVSPQQREQCEEGQLKTSNRSASTCPDVQSSTRKCTCTKTRCQKNYCQCFKIGQACSAECECKDCGNKEKLFLSKPVVIKIRCKCLRSHCLKNYCECHSAGQRCGIQCKCLECENILIQKCAEEKYDNFFDHHLFFDI